MNHKLNYRELIKNWMQFYGITAELSKQIFEAIWLYLQEETVNKKEKRNEQQLERSDRKGEK